jgi:hypothetical protein
MVVVQISRVELVLMANIWARFSSLAEWGNLPSVGSHLHSSEVSHVFDMTWKEQLIFSKKSTIAVYIIQGTF